MRVYHLISGRWGLAAIENKRLKISRLEDLNDPFELLGAELSKQEDRLTFARIKDILAQNRGVLCFSRNQHNPLLWSHYADRHRGICLVFDVPDHLVMPVCYEARRLRLQVERKIARGTLDEKFMNRLLTTKFKDWKYEEEVRVFCTLNDKEQEMGRYFANFSNKLSLRKIILGPRCIIGRAVKTELSSYSTIVKVVQARLAFRSFRVVRNKNVSIWP